MRKIFSILLFIVILSGCGHKESPTGGPEDTEKPVILNVLPSEYSDIKGKEIEIDFSKQMDRETFHTGLYIYPEIKAKRMKWKGNTLLIQIQEELQDSTNYLFSFSERIKGIHNNPLDKQYDFVWASGKFNDYRISGSFSFEEPEDAKEEVRVTLFSADTIRITTRTFRQNFEFPGLNPQAHSLRAYIDKNGNKKLDTEKEPFAETRTSAKPIVTANLFLTYQDSTPPLPQRINTPYTDELDIIFDENIINLENISITCKDSIHNGLPLPVKRWRIKEKEVKVFTAAQDTFSYMLYVKGATDKKNNIAETDSLEFKGTTKIDSLAPTVINIDPRDGSSVQSLKPELVITFSEVIFTKNLSAWLTETESGVKYVLNVIQGNSETFILQPAVSLTNFNTYEINLSVIDPRGNPLKDYKESIFLPIVTQDRQ